MSFSFWSCFWLFSPWGSWLSPWSSYSLSYILTIFKLCKIKLGNIKDIYHKFYSFDLILLSNYRFFFRIDSNIELNLWESLWYSKIIFLCVFSKFSSYYRILFFFASFSYSLFSSLFCVIASILFIRICSIYSCFSSYSLISLFL